MISVIHREYIRFGYISMMIADRSELQSPIDAFPVVRELNPYFSESEFYQDDLGKNMDNL